MKISSRGRYALLTLLDLAEHKSHGFISLKEIAQRQNISKLYLEQLVSLLSMSSILHANRGKQGGYMLAKEPSQCTVGQILRLTEGSFMPVSCLEDEVNKCVHAEFCKTLPLWTGLGKVINDYLNNITLQDILDQNQSGGNYVI
ncbi:MAG: Rrf2 family transcriptional regulator [Fibromonadales bacterium]|nr:Rrf2 family transcriptional regulator [Fibromonadales bacterium]